MKGTHESAIAEADYQECIAGVINRAERLLVLLDLEKMVSTDEKMLFTSM